MFHRPMSARDNQAWVAMRMVGDAVNRAKTAEVKTVRALMLSPDFEVADFKGVALTLRPWNLQLHQPILLTDGRGTVSVSPQEEFLPPGLGTRHAGLRSAGDQMQARLTLCAFALAACALSPAPSLANTAYVSNEKGNSISVIDTATLEVRKSG